MPRRLLLRDMSGVWYEIQGTDKKYILRSGGGNADDVTYTATLNELTYADTRVKFEAKVCPSSHRHRMTKQPQNGNK